MWDTENDAKIIALSLSLGDAVENINNSMETPKRGTKENENAPIEEHDNSLASHFMRKEMDHSELSFRLAKFRSLE